MRIPGFSVFFLVVAVFVACAGTSASAEVCNRVVAFVNDDVITLHELNRKIKNVMGIEPSELKLRDQKGYVETRKQVLDFLIDEKITREKIDELGIKVTPKELDEAIERIKEQNSLTKEDMTAKLRQEGITYEAYRENIRSEIERSRLINLEVKSRIIIREEDVMDYYENNRELFSNAEQVHLAAIFLRRKNGNETSGDDELLEKAGAVLARLENGDDFGLLARELSSGPGAKDGGDLGFFKMEQLDSRLLDVLDEMKPSQVSRPIITPQGAQIIKLLERKSESTKSFDEVRESIYDILYREEVNNRYLSWIKELRKTAFIKIIF